MKFIVLFLVVMFPVASLAAENPTFGEYVSYLQYLENTKDSNFASRYAADDGWQKKNIFENLEDYFGEASTEEDIKAFDAWYAGRCYMSQNPNVPLGSVLFGKAQFVERQNGPLFLERVTRVWSHESWSAKFYDNPDKSRMEKLESYAKKDLGDKDLRALVVDRADGAHVSSFPTRKQELRIKKLDKKYFIVKVVSGNDVYQMCYYFKKISR